MIERELKFSLSEDHFPDRQELALVFEASSFRLEPVSSHRQRDRYFDDARRSLRRAGVALRRRTLAGRTLATLKMGGSVSGSLHTREEIELPFEGREWPEEIRRRLSPIISLPALRRQLELTTERLRYLVKGSDREVALLSFDAVTASYPGSGQSVHFNEVEVEALGEATVEELQAVAVLVEQLLPLTPNSSSKLERAEALLALGASFHE